MNDKGWDVYFVSKEGSWAERRKSDELLNVERTGGRFELVVKQVSGAGALSGGSGQALL